jgi:hypothetical protein
MPVGIVHVQTITESSQEKKKKVEKTLKIKAKVNLHSQLWGQ